MFSLLVMWLSIWLLLGLVAVGVTMLVEVGQAGTEPQLALRLPTQGLL
jgi:hypothetical protein